MCYNSFEGKNCEKGNQAMSEYIYLNEELEKGENNTVAIAANTKNGISISDPMDFYSYDIESMTTDDLEEMLRQVQDLYDDWEMDEPENEEERDEWENQLSEIEDMIGEIQDRIDELDLE